MLLHRGHYKGRRDDDEKLDTNLGRWHIQQSGRDISHPLRYTYNATSLRYTVHAINFRISTHTTILTNVQHVTLISSDMKPHPTLSLHLGPQSTHQIILDPIVKYHSPNQHIHPNEDQHYHLSHSIWPFFSVIVLFIVIRIASAFVGVGVWGWRS